eukprot:11201742-Lingulodinium_polyedra.AAC.1
MARVDRVDAALPTTATELGEIAELDHPVGGPGELPVGEALVEQGGVDLSAPVAERGAGNP